MFLFDPLLNMFDTHIAPGVGLAERNGFFDRVAVAGFNRLAEAIGHAGLMIA